MSHGLEQWQISCVPFMFINVDLLIKEKPRRKNVPLYEYYLQKQITPYRWMVCGLYYETSLSQVLSLVAVSRCRKTGTHITAT